MTPSPDPAIAAQQHWMAVLARASAAAIRDALTLCPALPEHRVLRGPESGLVMLRGRAGGVGEKFNLGEMTVTRCTVRGGERIGHAYIAGRDRDHAELAARVDAAMQDPALRPALERSVIRPLAEAQAEAASAQAKRAAATQVQFFTMATMRS
jgi:alpha-D-ribose 1-methylphosphonate 5-triphosphate synthase subunit PhnG